MDVRLLGRFCEQVYINDEIEFEIERNGNSRVTCIVVTNTTRSVAMRIQVKSTTIREDRLSLIMLRQTLELRIQRMFTRTQTIIVDDVQDSQGITLPEAHNRMAGQPFAQDQNEITQLHKLFCHVGPMLR